MSCAQIGSPGAMVKKRVHDKVEKTGSSDIPWRSQWPDHAGSRQGDDGFSRPATVARSVKGKLRLIPTLRPASTHTNGTND